MLREGPLYQAAAKMMEHGLRRQDSVFTPGSPVWTLPAARDFEDRFITKGDAGNGSFIADFPQVGYLKS